MTIVSSIFRFYVDGFRRMTLGKTLWAIILIKLFVLFAIVKVFLLPGYLNSRYDTSEQKSDYVASQLTTLPDSTTP
jgi:TM2 domain-containing membrane protein YozV